MIIFLMLFSALVGAQDTALLKPQESCKATESTRHVYIVKQWHLSPATNTFINPQQSLPQTENIKAIFKQVSEWIDSKKISSVLAEGCEGPLTDKFLKVFNGWDITQLKAHVRDSEFASLGTHIPMKLEARYGDKLSTFCADNEKLITEGSLLLSNLRAYTGYYTRIKEHSGKPAQKNYLDGAVKALKLAPTSNADQTLAALRTASEKAIADFQKTLESRNQVMLTAAEKHTDKTTALIVGGLHARDLKSKIEAKGWNCTVYEPAGYSPQSESLIQDLKSALAK